MLRSKAPNVLLSEGISRDDGDISEAGDDIVRSSRKDVPGRKMVSCPVRRDKFI